MWLLTNNFFPNFFDFFSKLVYLFDTNLSGERRCLFSTKNFSKVFNLIYVERQNASRWLRTVLPGIEKIRVTKLRLKRIICTNINEFLMWLNISFRVHNDHSKAKILLRHFCDSHRRTRPHTRQNHFFLDYNRVTCFQACSLFLSKVAPVLVLMQLEQWLEALVSSANLVFLKFMHRWILHIHEYIDRQTLEGGYCREWGSKSRKNVTNFRIHIGTY